MLLLLVVFVFGFLFFFLIMEEIGLPVESISMDVDSILQRKDEKEEDYEVSYERMKELQRELEFIDIQVPFSRFFYNLLSLFFLIHSIFIGNIHQR